MQRRQITALALLPLLAAAHARAQGLAGINDLDASKGLKAALETGAIAAVKLLGRPDGFLAGEEEKKIRRDPVGTGSALLSKVFGSLR